MKPTYEELREALNEAQAFISASMRRETKNGNHELAAAIGAFYSECRRLIAESEDRVA